MMDAATAAQAIAGEVVGGNAWFTGVTTDSRAVVPGDLFVAIAGERFDGHDFVASAFAHGASAAIVSNERLEALREADSGVDAGSLLAVADPLRALGALARFWRRRFAIPLAAVVGSNGKTTVKEMIASILRVQFGAEHVLATAGNLNNEIGMPLTLLRLSPEHRAAVIEIGMNHPGETAALAGIAQPTIGLINNAQREHQEFMKSVSDVAAEHAALLAALPRGGIAVINADDDFASFWRDVAARCNAEGKGIVVRDFGLVAAAGISARCSARAWGQVVELTTDVGTATIDLMASGRHNAANALAASAVALAAGATLNAVTQGLAEFRAVAGRLQLKAGTRGATVIDDTYNANPDSVRAAISVLAQLGPPRYLVLGDMGEVGDKAVAFHREIGEYARGAGVDRLLALGDLTRHAVDAFGAGGEHFDDIQALSAAAASAAASGATLLVKGSRFMRMERVVAALTTNADAPGSH
jgi:UDP-N-acetylmuramoyl-tripeptide--D-alanyl-D-alanine ligase